jgi:uncharacterized protein (TIGR04255 family)
MSQLTRPSGLPDFVRPPINEVVLSVQFRALPKFGNGHIGMLWNRYRKDYPELEEKPALQSDLETFGVGQPAPQGIHIQTLLAPPMSRFWFVNSSGHELIQVQQDRFLHNWRQREEEQPYPHYEVVRERFEQELAVFEKFARDENLGELKMNQCEVTYINVIEIEETKPFLALEKITPLWTGDLSEEIELERENAQIRFSLRLLEGGKPIGRVHVKFDPAHRNLDRKQVIRLEITARAKPTDESVAAALHLLDEERKYVVRTFAAATTRAMHELWERTDAR